MHEGALMQSLYKILMLLLDTVYYVILVHVIMSWLINFQVLNLRQPLVSQIWYGLNRMLEPLYSRVRRILPPTGGIDFAPLVVLIIVIILRIVLTNNAAYFL
jgi:YggT family protein